MKKNRSLQLSFKVKSGFYKLISFSIILVMSGCWGQKRAKKVYADNVKNAPFDAIIVPGIPYNGEHWDDVMMIRVYWAKYLYDQGITKHIIFSGSAVYTKYYEAEIMKKYAIALGIPEKVIFTDTLAEHSTENVYYSLLQAYDLGFEKMALATDPYQSYFMRRVFKQTKVKSLMHLPINYDILESMAKPEPDIDPTSAIKENFIPLTERESTTARWRGTMGKNVDFSKLK
ncbi:YdcF family protein [Owenweeksia hongkongensis]|uniref:YdcF family protein n=1 Tax=Owenweeksia hongkongensis TaxID=253245 RepID=UPI003A952887